MLIVEGDTKYCLIKVSGGQLIIVLHWLFVQVEWKIVNPMIMMKKKNKMIMKLVMKVKQMGQMKQIVLVGGGKEDWRKLK